MPQPTESDVHVSRPLTNISIAFMQKAEDFIADKVFPAVPVSKQADAYWTYDQAYWNRDEMQERAPATESAGSGYTVDASNTYYARIYAFHKDIPDPIRANADAPLDLDREATMYVSLKGLLKREKMFVDAYFKGGVWTRDYDGVASSPSTNQVLQWSDVNSTPIEDVWAAKADIKRKTGYLPNKMVIGYDVVVALINHPDIIDRVKYGQTPGKIAMADLSELAQVFKVEEILVCQAIENTAKEGAAAVTDFMAGKKAMLVYAPPSPGLMTPSGGYVFAWTGYLGAGPGGQRVKRFRMENIESDRVEMEMAFDMKLISADLGAFFDAIVA